MKVIKYRDRTEEKIWELVRIDQPQFDPQTTHALIGLPIGGKHKELQWLNLQKHPIVWIKEFHA